MIMTECRESFALFMKKNSDITELDTAEWMCVAKMLLKNLLCRVSRTEQASAVNSFWL